MNFYVYKYAIELFTFSVYNTSEFAIIIVQKWLGMQLLLYYE